MISLLPPNSVHYMTLCSIYRKSPAKPRRAAAPAPISALRLAAPAKALVDDAVAAPAVVEVARPVAPAVPLEEPPVGYGAEPAPEPADPVAVEPDSPLSPAEGTGVGTPEVLTVLPEAGAVADATEECVLEESAEEVSLEELADELEDESSQERS